MKKGEFMQNIGTGYRSYLESIFLQLNIVEIYGPLTTILKIN